jgi:hypothetical protein
MECRIVVGYGYTKSLGGRFLTIPNLVTKLVEDGLTMTTAANVRFLLALRLEWQIKNVALLHAVRYARKLGQMTSTLNVLAIDGKRAARLVVDAAFLAAAWNRRPSATAMVLAQQPLCCGNLAPANFARRKTGNRQRRS